MLLISSFLGISVNNILLTWGFIDFNILFFIPLIRFNSNFYSYITRIKYFLIQSLGSIFLLGSILFLFLLNKNTFFQIVMVVRLLWKIGFPPFHFWLFSLIIELRWFLFFLLSSWQKILPFFLVRKIYINFLDVFIILRLFICVVSSSQQSRIKKLIIFSTIFTSSWILASMTIFKNIWLILLLLYRILLAFFIRFSLSHNFSRKDSTNINYMGQLDKIFVFLIFLSMAGIPPFIGFFIKVWVIFILIMFKKTFLAFIFVISSIFIIFIYARIFLRRLIYSCASSKFYYPRKIFYLSFYVFSFLGGPVIYLYY